MHPRSSEVRTRFSEQFVERNRLREAGFDRWAFHPDMLFGARDKWWGDRGPRPRPHEGIDLCVYTDRQGRPVVLGESTRIPVMFDGEIIKVEEDFLGKSIYVIHAVDDGKGRRLCTLYGHTAPLEHIGPGTRVREGEIIGSFPEKRKKTPGPRPHLHLTIAWVSPERALGELRWETLHDPGIAVLLDPLHAMGCPYRILDPDVSLQSC